MNFTHDLKRQLLEIFWMLNSLFGVRMELGIKDGIAG